MMSEKRFKGYAEKTGQHYELIIIDEIGEEYSLTDDFFKSKDVIFEIVDLLNVMNDTLVTQARENHKLSNKNIEQQATIQSLQEQLQDYKEIKDNWDSMVAKATEVSLRNVKLAEENTRLQRKIDEKHKTKGVKNDII